MSTQRINQSTHTRLHTSGSSQQYYNIKGVYPQGNGTVTYIDDSGVSLTANVFAGNTPPFICGNVNITNCSPDLIIL